MNMTQPLDLRDVTICAADSINPALAARALEISMSQCGFGDAILFTHEAVPTRARVVPIPRLQSREAYSTFLLKDLVKSISTPWILVVQWDGYVVDAAQWSDAFFQYDYIGAVWPHRGGGAQVGNGGFSLRSARLLQALASDRFAVPADAIEDELICVNYRPVLEAEFGIRFAPADIASRFSYEYVAPNQPTFGFHGPFNMWRYVDDPAMIEMLRTLDVRSLESKESLQLLANFAALRKFACLKTMYERYRSRWRAQEVVDALTLHGVQRETAKECVRICESTRLG